MATPDELHDKAARAALFIRDCRFVRSVNGGAIQISKEDLEDVLTWAEDIVGSLPGVLEALRKDETGELRASLFMR